MNLKLTDIFKYLLKWKYRIIAVIILVFFAARFYVDTIQTSVGEVIIKYNDAEISDGKFPDGSAFDQYQIASPEVLQNVINELGLKDSVETLRRKIEVTPITPAAVQELQAAKAKDGEEYEYNPDTFIVSYYGKRNQKAYKVRELLETMTFKYIDYYSESYNKFAAINNSLADNNFENYDYIEATEILENNIKEIIETLGKYKEADGGFRSTGTGYSFQDLIYKYEHLQKSDIPSLYAEIYEGKISKNSDRLIELYRQRSNEALLKQKNFVETAQMTKTKMDSFSDANKELPNAYNYRRDDQNDDKLAIIDDVYDEYKQRTASKTTYDTLIENYTNQLISANDSYLEAMHCKKIADIFSGASSENDNNEKLAENVKNEIESLTAKMTELYTSLSATVDDYNDYSAQKHISLLTGVKCYDNVSAALYEMIAVVLAAVVMVLVALTLEIVKTYKKEQDSIENAGENKEE